MADKRRNVCPRCNYIGNQHLCGCMARLGEALTAGDLGQARERYEHITGCANADERERRAM